LLALPFGLSARAANSSSTRPPCQLLFFSFAFSFPTRAT
jgi:hypothetical protein